MTTRTAASMMLAALLLAAAAPAAAQQVQAELPDSVAERIVAFYNRAGTARVMGNAHIAAGTTMQGGLAVLGGAVLVDGTVEGDVVVINGTLEVRASGVIRGAATVAGGDAHIDSAGTVSGGATVYREALRYRQDEDELVYVPPDAERGLSAGVDLPFGRTDVLIASQGAYNRAEGLAVALGPRVRFTGTHTTMAQALLIARTATASELDARRFGFDVRAEQVVDREHGLTLGARLYSLIVPIEEWWLPDREAALAAFVFRRDYRDHYEREGWSGYARLARPGYPYSITLEYRDEEHAVAPPADPFSLLHRNDDWRPQPLVAEGALRSIVASVRYDTRNEQRDPSAGWLIDAALERGLGGGITIPLAAAPGEDVADARSGFLTSRIDVRRYARLAPYSRLALRVVALGSLDARALPPQRQHALGGEGSLPGFGLFAFACGARAAAVQRGAQPFYPYYGCDRLALIQLEYQAAFPFGRRLGQRAGLGSLAHLARWVAFFDAGRAWIEPAARRGRPGGNDDFSVDAGLGIRFGPLGAYWAVPFSGRAEKVNFFIRVEPRI
jgi:hypothetical protein